MAISVTHGFVSAKSDDIDASFVRPSNWNAAHSFTMSTDKLLGRGTAADGVVEEITLGTNLSLTGTTLNAVLGGGVAAVVTPQGRLTLQTAVPVMTTTQSAKTTIYYTPYCGNQIGLYDGSNVVVTTFAELSNVTTAAAVGSAGPAAVAANSVYDLFVWSNAGTVTLTRGPVWSSDTARSAGTALVMVNGVLLNSVAITNGPAASRGTYVGTVRSNASSQLDWIFGATATGGTAGFLGVWNAYNRRQVVSRSSDNTVNWTYNGAGTPHSANSSNAMRCSFVTGLAEDAYWAVYSSRTTASAAGIATIAIGLDSTSVYYPGALAFVPTSADMWLNTHPLAGAPILGFHFVQALERSSGGGTSAFSGSDGEDGFRNGGLTFMGWM